MNFKSWLLSEEIFPNKTATVFHRTKDIQNLENILSRGFKTGEGCMYGCGLYTTFSLESQFYDYMAKYGEVIVKFKVTDLDKYLIFHPSVAKYVLGSKYTLKDQLEKFNIKNIKEEIITQADEELKRSPFSAKVAQEFTSIYANDIISLKKVKGVIYRGSSDGYCLVKYEPVEDGTISVLGYAVAHTNDVNKMKELLANKEWITSTQSLKMKQIATLSPEKKEKFSEIKNFRKYISYAIENNLDLGKFIKNIDPRELEIVNYNDAYNLALEIPEENLTNIIESLLKIKNIQNSPQLLAAFMARLSPITLNTDQVSLKTELIKKVINVLDFKQIENNPKLIRYFNDVLTALANSKDVSSVRHFIEKGFTVQFKTIPSIVKLDNPEILKLLMDTQSFNFTSDDIDTALDSRKFKSAMFLINSGVKITTSNIVKGMASLLDVSFLELLLDKMGGIQNLNKIEIYDRTEFNIRMGLDQYVKFIINKGLPVTKELIDAAKNSGNKSIEQFLISKSK